MVTLYKKCLLEVTSPSSGAPGCPRGLSKAGSDGRAGDQGHSLRGVACSGGDRWLAGWLATCRRHFDSPTKQAGGHAQRRARRGFLSPAGRCVVVGHLRVPGSTRSTSESTWKKVGAKLRAASSYYVHRPWRGGQRIFPTRVGTSVEIFLKLTCA